MSKQSGVSKNAGGGTPFDFGENVVAKLEGDTLHLAIDLSVKGNKSKSGKTVVVASTRGNQPLPEVSPRTRVGLNIYRD